MPVVLVQLDRFGIRQEQCAVMSGHALRPEEQLGRATRMHLQFRQGHCA